tara:strand:+ start:413 stop:619 length:207 start_codon:yes stop_codon:yes gene_type:complete
MKIKVSEVVENDDGSANVVFDCDDEFEKWFLETHNLTEWDHDIFEKWILNILLEKFKSVDKKVPDECG